MCEISQKDPIPIECLRSGIDYISRRVENEGEIEVIDCGRDGIHSEPIVFATWPDSTCVEKGSFITSIYTPEIIAKQYSPEENIRIGYDDDASMTKGKYLGERKSVDFYLSNHERREVFRNNSGDALVPVDGWEESIERLFADSDA